MMRSVINEGTGAGARGAGFTLDAAGKSGTTNDLRDAWFVGFTPELLAVVWVGFDDNTPLGLSGTQAALPIWTEFMKRALAGHDNVSFEPPEGISLRRDRPRHRPPGPTDLPTDDDRSLSSPAPNRSRSATCTDGEHECAQITGDQATLAERTCLLISLTRAAETPPQRYNP